MERAHFQSICPKQIMEWKQYNRDSRVFPALMTSALGVGWGGDAREVQDRVLALNKPMFWLGNQDVYA